mmetsp:Transcript_86890/g.144990  ORF Transcript_86890/g.144990 Transcript_86890/m.144990 type:complete len:94 (+) Transcript_86890:336-617(+)
MVSPLMTPSSAHPHIRLLCGVAHCISPQPPPLYPMNTPLPPHRILFVSLLRQQDTHSVPGCVVQLGSQEDGQEHAAELSRALPQRRPELAPAS